MLHTSAQMPMKNTCMVFFCDRFRGWCNKIYNLHSEEHFKVRL